MTAPTRRVVCATRRPLFVDSLREVFQRAGFTREPVTVPPVRLRGAVREHKGCLAIVDGSAVPFWQTLADAQAIAPTSQFVLCSKRVTPLLVREAFECGVHGVLSLRLAVDDAAQALIQICRGERQFRFDPPRTRFVIPPRMELARETAAVPQPGPEDFDALWMFESGTGV